MGHVYQAGYVCGEHCVDIGGFDVRGLVYAFYEAAVYGLEGVDEHGGCRETNALLTKTSILLNSSGRPSTNAETSAGFDTSILTLCIFTPSPTSCRISCANSSSFSNLRAVRINRRLFGAVLANSFAVLLPIPDEAPVIKTVFPSSLFAAEEEALRVVVYNFGDRGIGRRRCDPVVRRICERVRRVRAGIWKPKTGINITIEEESFKALCAACGELSAMPTSATGELGHLSVSQPPLVFNVKLLWKNMGTTTFFIELWLESVLSFFYHDF